MGKSGARAAPSGRAALPLAQGALLVLLSVPGRDAAESVLPGPVEVYRTALYTGERLARLEDLQWVLLADERPPQTPRLEVDSSKIRQALLGFGGAFTEASAVNWMKLDKSAREKVIKLYFDSPENGGNGYSVGRVHINSCDFSVGSYSFDDVANDTNLSHFDTEVKHDQEAMLPFMWAAMKQAASWLQRPVEEALSILGSPWSPPAWMKIPWKSEEGNMIQSMKSSAKPMGLQPEYQRTWANYLSKFVTAYKKQGVKLWGITAQNEPEMASTWEACEWTARNESLWIRDHLGPVMRQDHPELQILGFDHNKDDVVDWANELYRADNGATASFVDGLAMHWYTGDYFRQVEQAAQIGGEGKWLIPSESCSCPSVAWGSAQVAERWKRAEYLAHDIIGDLAAGAHAYLDWNLVLDPSGGPNHVGSSCDAAIIADPDHILGQDSSVVLQPSYYYMGHFSRFLPPGSKVLESVFNVDMPDDTFPSAYLSTFVSYDHKHPLDISPQGIVGIAGCDAGSRQVWMIDQIPSAPGSRRMESHSAPEHHHDHVAPEGHIGHMKDDAKSKTFLEEATTAAASDTTTATTATNWPSSATTVSTTPGPSSCIHLREITNSRGNKAAHGILPSVCLDLKDGNTSDGAPVQFWSCHAELGWPCISDLPDALNQRWQIGPHPMKGKPEKNGAHAIEIVSKVSGKCVTVPEDHYVGMALQLWPCKGSPRQRFIQETNGVLRWAPGHRRHGAAQCLTAGNFKSLESIAGFSEKDDQVSLVVLNRGERAANFQLFDVATNAVSEFICAPARSMTSFKYARRAVSPAPTQTPTVPPVVAAADDHRESYSNSGVMLLVLLAGCCAILAAFANGILIGTGTTALRLRARGLNSYADVRQFPAT